jgi:xylose dehydrogenase (NAD/NADP)
MSQEPADSEAITRWGFLGAGFVATKALAPAVHAADNAVLQIVAARDADRAIALEPLQTATDYGAVCSSPDVDVVYVALANDDHLPWVLRALKSGKHVVCEKPLGLSAAQVAKMTKAADASGKLLVEAVWNRWHPRTIRALELVSQAKADDSYLNIESWFTFTGVPSGNYRMQPGQGGGALLDLGSYVVGMALAALGSGDVSVHALKRHRADTGVDLTTEMVLRHPAGQAKLRVSFEQDESQGLTISLPHMVVRLGGASPSDQALTNWNAPSTLTLSHDGATSVEVFAPCDPYQLMVEAVSARVQGKDAWVLPLADSLRVAKVLDLIADTDT